MSDTLSSFFAALGFIRGMVVVGSGMLNCSLFSGIFKCGVVVVLYTDSQDAIPFLVTSHFPVAHVISRTRMFHTSECIIARCGGKMGVAPGDLCLYRISVVDGSKLARLDLEENQPLLPRTTVAALFPDILGESDYVLVANRIMLRCGLICV